MCGGERPTEEVALAFHTVVGLKECQLLLRFDALGNHALLEAFPHVNDRSHDGRVIEIASDLLHEGLVDFQDINGKPLQIAEAGVTGTEVIHRKVYSDRLERVQYGRRGFGMMHENAFGEFEVEVARFEAGFLERGADLCEKKS